MLEEIVTSQSGCEHFDSCEIPAPLLSIVPLQRSEQMGAYFPIKQNGLRTLWVRISRWNLKWIMALGRESEARAFFNLIRQHYPDGSTRAFTAHSVHFVLLGLILHAVHFRVAQDPSRYYKWTTRSWIGCIIWDLGWIKQHDPFPYFYFSLSTTFQSVAT